MHANGFAALKDKEEHIMAMVVQHNLTAMNSNRMLGVTTSAQAKSSEKLSSGFKINRAADDAAGLTISEKMRKQMRGLDRASTNAQDGVSAVQTAEGALTEVHSMLQRMNELAVQSANGTNSESDREAIQAEIDQLYTEINRVAETTKFNETYLLKGNEAGDKKTVYSYKTVAVDAAFEGLNNKTFADFYAAGSGTAYADEDSLLQDLEDGKKIYSAAPVNQDVADKVTAGTEYTITNATATKTGGTTIAAGNISNTAAAGTYTYTGGAWQDPDGNTVGTTGSDADMSILLGVTVNGSSNTDTITITAASVTTTGDIYAEGGTEKLSDAEIIAADAAGDDMYSTAATQAEAVADTDYTYTPAGNQRSQFYDENGKEVAASKTAEMLENGDKLYDGADKATATEITATNIADYTDSAEVNADLEFNLHVGADSSDDNKIGVKIAAMSAAGIGLGAKLDVSTEDTATAAIDIISDAIQMVSTQRSALGAIQNRLEHTIANLDNVVENTTAAESRIRDTDMAEEMVEYSKNNILAQAGQSMLAQANQATQGVLSLLQ